MEFQEYWDNDEGSPEDTDVDLLSPEEIEIPASVYVTLHRYEPIPIQNRS
jgi:hypothetical protein